MRFAFFVAVVFLTSQVFAFHTGSGFGCEVRQSCNFNEVCVLSMSSSENAHASDCSAYDTKLCCTKFAQVSLKSTCSQGEYGLLSVSALTGDAHVAEYYDPFALQVCAEYDGDLSCQYSATQPSGYDCVLGMSSSSNAHLGSCSDTSGGALWCDATAVVEGHRFTVKTTLGSDSNAYIDNAGVKEFAELQAGTLSTETKYLFGYKDNRFYGSVLAEGDVDGADIEKRVSDYDLSLDATPDGKILLFFTKGDLEQAVGVSERVSSTQRSDLSSTYFGLLEQSDYRVSVGIQPSRYIDLQGSEIFSPGSYELIVRGADTTNDAEIIEIRRK